jgi:TP901 family phage tail tape measure protein
MSRFVLTAQLQLQAPNNVAQVVRQIQSQLNNVQINVQVQGAQQSQRQLQQITQNTNQATSAAERMGRAFAVSVRRFAAFSIATRAVGLFTSTLSDAVQTAIDFERQLIKVSQVTGKSVGKLRDLTNEITNLSTGLGVSSSSLLEVTTVLAQAGLTAEDTKVALNSLAKAALAPNFDSITETAEGAIAILAQFGQGVGALEKQLGSINAVAGAFAVEASDLIDVIRRTGGVFKSSGGDLNELLALFTSVRATTRESAESIGTGLRTIFTRIQRPKTIEFLKQFGVELVDLEGKFIGPFEAIKRLSAQLTGLGERDITFIQIAEELGGFRQIGKVLPLLQQFSTAQAALNVATKSGNSLAQDAASAQAALAIRILKVKEEFLALIRSVTETSTFQIMANTALSLASALIKIGDAIKPLLPMLAALAAFRIAKGLGTFAGGLMGGLSSARTYNKGGKVHHFARGGLVPGSGNRDTVPAMLSPGEFVIRKSSVNKMGAGNLAAMNENRYAAGGKVTSGRYTYGGRPLSIAQISRNISGNQTYSETSVRALKSSDPNKYKELEEQAARNIVNRKKAQEQKDYDNSTNKLKSKYPGGVFTTAPGAIGGFFLTPEKGSDTPYKLSKPYPFQMKDGAKAVIRQGSEIENYVPFRNDVKKLNDINNLIDNSSRGALAGAINGIAPQLDQLFSSSAINFDASTISDAANRLTSDKNGKVNNAVSTVAGYVFEGIIDGITGAKLAGGTETFDYPSVASNRSNLARMFSKNESEMSNLIKGDAKRSQNSKSNMSIFKKISNEIKSGKVGLPNGILQLASGGLVKKFATGGGVDPKDTLERFYKDSSSFNLGLANSKGLGKGQRRQLASDVRDMRKLRGQAPSTLYSSISRVAFDRMASQVGLNKNPKIPEGTRLFDRAKYYSEEVQKIIGKTFSLPGFVSTSKDSNKAKSFLDNAPRADDQWAAMMTILTKPNAMGVDVASQLSGRTINATKQDINPRTGKMETFSMNQPGSESEFTLSPRSRFRINSAKFVDMIGRKNLWMDVQQFAKGGGVGTDTVPALLTPGEFVVNRKSAQKIGYGSLNRMNKVGKYANGGVVQRFAAGTGTSGVKPVSGGAANPIYVTTAEEAAKLASSCREASEATRDVTVNNRLLTASIAPVVLGMVQSFIPALDESSGAMSRVVHSLLNLSTTLVGVGLALGAFGVSLNAKNIMEFFGSGPNSIGGMLSSGASNAFKGFKMGAAGQAGPMPLGGGMAARAGEVFSKGRNALNSAGSNINSYGSAMGSNLNKGFSAGLSGKSVVGGGSRSILGNIGGFAGQGVRKFNNSTMAESFRYGMEQRDLPLSRVGAFSRVSEQINGSGKFKQGLADISSRGGALYGRARDKIGESRSQFSKGLNAGFTEKNLSFGKIFGSNRGVAAKAGGVIGKIGNSAANIPGVQALTKVLGPLTGSFSGVGAAVAASLGPLLAFSGGVFVLNNVISSFRNLEGELKKAIKAGDAESAARLAVSKNIEDTAGGLIGGLVSLFGSGAEESFAGFLTLIGGNSVDSIKANVQAQIQAAKTTKAFEQGQKDAEKAMEDFNNGTISATEALRRISNINIQAQNLQDANNKANATNVGNKSTGGSAVARNIFTLGGLVGESSSERNNRIDAENAERNKQTIEAQRKAFDLTRPLSNQAIRSGVLQNKTREQVDADLEASGAMSSRKLRSSASDLKIQATRFDQSGNKEQGDALREQAAVMEEQAKELDKSFENLQKEVEISRKKFEAINLGFRNVISSSDAAALRMNNLMSSFEVGTTAAVQAMATLEASLTSAGQNISSADFGGALNEVTGVMKQFGASSTEINKFRDNLTAVATVQKNFPQIFDNMKNKIKEGGFTNMSADDAGKEFKKQVREQLDIAKVSPEVRDRILDAMGDVKLKPEDIDAIGRGDYSVLEKYLEDAGEEAKRVMKGVIDNFAKINQQLIQLTKERIDAERNLVEAQKEALGLYLEGRELQAKYGGQAVSSKERRNVLLAQSNVETNRLGLTPLQNGTPEEFRARNQELMASFSSIEAQRRQSNGMQGAEGVSADEAQKDLQKAYKSQIESIRNTIKLEEEELKILQEKNKLEKQSLESLISGDIEKFFEQQSAVGAQAAVATGNESLINQFGGQALGAAYSDLQRQQEAGVQTAFGMQLGGAGGLLERSAGAALSARGVQNPLMAQRLAGTTPEEEARKASLRGLGGVLAETGQVGIDMAQMQLNTAEIKIDQAKVIMSNLDTGGNPEVQGKYRGGIVYANRGIFVPRGTDTVPAMLTPGEFVVRREAVNRGNNLQLLQAMNSGNSNVAQASPQALSRGGSVQYLAGGGIAGLLQNIIGPDIFSGLVKSLTAFGSQMSENIKSLQNTKFQITLDTTNVNINLSGGSFLNSMKEEIKQQLLSEIGSRLNNSSVNSAGKVNTETNQVLPSVR